MKNLLNNFVLCIVFIGIISTAKGQIHDFDSLYKNNKDFKKSFRASSDSKGIFDSEEILKITIESDFKNLVKMKSNLPYSNSSIMTPLL